MEGSLTRCWCEGEGITSLHRQMRSADHWLRCLHEKAPKDQQHIVEEDGSRIDVGHPSNECMLESKIKVLDPERAEETCAAKAVTSAALAIEATSTLVLLSAPLTMSFISMTSLKPCNMADAVHRYYSFVKSHAKADTGGVATSAVNTDTCARHRLFWRRFCCITPWQGPSRFRVQKHGRMPSYAR